MLNNNQSLTPMNTFYIGDSLCIQNGLKFTTKDQDNDEYSPSNGATNFHDGYDLNHKTTIITLVSER